MKLVEVEKVEWVNKKSYSTVALVLQDRDYRILLRTNDGLEDWFELLEVSVILHRMDICDGRFNFSHLSSVIVVHRTNAMIFRLRIPFPSS